MDKVHKETLQVTKEIVVKFIETGRVSPANFAEIFPSVYSVIRRTLVDAQFSVLAGANIPDANIPDADARNMNAQNLDTPDVNASGKNAKGRV